MTTVHSSPTTSADLDVLHPSHFAYRHIGPRREDVAEMIETLGYPSVDAFIDAVVPSEIRLRRPLALPPGRSEREVLQALRGLAGMNRVFRSYIGMGYAGCFTPQVVQRNVLENPGWYTAYTPYQAEIAQGRLEALLNFQTVVSDLTGLEIANASLLDEATAAAEAMHLTLAVHSSVTDPVFLVDEYCHPQTIAVVQTRAEARGVRVVVAEPETFNFEPGVIGALVQYPATDGAVRDFHSLCERAHAAGALVTAATDLLALTLLTPPDEWGADIAVGNSQRFGVPMGYGGPHAAFFATRDKHKRFMPGRIIGVSRDRDGRPALRMALQTREQHIRRDKATSNVCTAQVLLAVMASMYAVYHGPGGVSTVSASRSVAAVTRAPAAWARSQSERKSRIAPSVAGYCTRAPITPGSKANVSGSATTTRTPRASARVCTTAIVWGWQYSSTRKTGSVTEGCTARVRCIASAAAVASSSSDALAISRPVRSETTVWKLSSASSRPWAISA